MVLAVRRRFVTAWPGQWRHFCGFPALRRRAALRTLIEGNLAALGAEAAEARPEEAGRQKHLLEVVLRALPPPPKSWLATSCI